MTGSVGGTSIWFKLRHQVPSELSHLERAFILPPILNRVVKRTTKPLQEVRPISGSNVNTYLRTKRDLFDPTRLNNTGASATNCRASGGGTHTLISVSGPF